MNGWTHFSSRRLSFTCKASVSLRVTSAEILFPLRLQNVRKQEMRYGSTNLFTLCKRCTQSRHIPRQLFIIYSAPSDRKLGGGPWTRLHTIICASIYSVKCIGQCLQVLAQAWEWHYSLRVHLLMNKTWMAWLTWASEGSGSLAKLHPIYVHRQMWSHSHWGCRMSENKRKRGMWFKKSSWMYNISISQKL